jgi:hypothetical protein
VPDLIHLNTETFNTPTKAHVGKLEASKPYVTVFLIVTILLSVWAGLCAA